ncbi:MAG: DNA cytosine methyltransferase, partial [Patescibacteria group bacterium]|nr:DNA cytosine methyltransferase [Patescibacteria group bacterium]
MKKKLKVIDLFSGCGGSALGFKQAGFDIRVAVDINKIASETFKANFPSSHVISNDISYVSSQDLLDAAKEKNGEGIVIIACPPCQGFSTARRKSEMLTDPRNRLIYEFLRVVKEIRPMAFVMENVPGLANGAGKLMFLDILQRLKELGYTTTHGVVDVADYGVPQRRKRLVMLGTNRTDIRISFPSKTNQDPNLKDRYLPPWNTVRNVISDLSAISAGETSLNDPLHHSPKLADINLQRMSHTPHDGGDRLSWPEELILECHKKVNGYKDIYGRMRWDTPSPTITAGCVMISKGRYGHPEQNRAMSLREAARL